MSRQIRINSDGRERSSNPARDLIADLADKHVIDKYVYDKSFLEKLKPGQLIQSLPEEKRNILKTLTSEDVANIRWPKNNIV